MDHELMTEKGLTRFVYKSYIGTAEWQLFKRMCSFDKHLTYSNSTLSIYMVHILCSGASSHMVMQNYPVKYKETIMCHTQTRLKGFKKIFTLK